MKQRERGEYYALAGVLNLVEQQVAKRAAMPVAALRVLLRVAALTGSGALVRGTDIARAATSARQEVRTNLKRLRHRDSWLTIRGGGVVSGYYELTPTGKAVCTEFASAWRRAVSNFLAFENASPFRRLEPHKQ